MDFHTPLEKIFKIPQEQKKTLEKMEIFSVQDLLYTMPVKYGDIEKNLSIKDLGDGQKANVFGKIISISAKKTFNSKIPITEAFLEDFSGEKIKIIWFSQAYISKFLNVGENVKISGKIAEKNGSKIFTNPEFEKIEKIPMNLEGGLFSKEEKFLPSLFPTYKESGTKKGKISSKWIYHKIKKILSDQDFLEKIKEPIDKKILKKYNLPSLKNSFFYLHLPKEKKDFEVAKKRFAFEEIFFIQLIKAIERKNYQKYGAFVIEKEQKKYESFLGNFGFSLTESQKKVLKSIEKDFQKGVPMSRLLEGDVGSGKTAVAAAACFLVSETLPKDQSFGKIQTAYMAPTEILAKQIFSEFIKFFSPFGKKMALLTSKDVQIFPSKVDKKNPAKISKKKLQEMILNGEINIVVGTHALISKNVFFENLGFVIIDEQHRFGKKQRASLRQKPMEKKQAKEDGKIFSSKKIIKKGVAENDDILPHLLSMTATPIPRTLALSLYGDLDLSIMDQMPSGRKKVETEICKEDPEERKKVYQKCKKQLEEGRQMYVICARIDEPDLEKKSALNVKSAISMQKNLKENELFQKYNVGLLHSKMKKEQKDKVMEDFLEKKIDILVSTSVIEVGVSVENATTMIIEGGERFGLSQLHQFRGRIQRSTKQPHCFIFADTKTEKTRQRMEVMKKAKNGFELAEYDLKFRGAGEILGNKQSGISDLAMDAIKNLKMVEAAREESQNLVDKDLYKKSKNLLEKMQKIKRKIYME